MGQTHFSPHGAVRHAQDAALLWKIRVRAEYTRYTIVCTSVTSQRYARAQAAGVECVPLLVETFGGMSPALYDALREASDWRANKLTSSEYDETTWSARTWMTFVAQRISVAVQLSSAQEVAEALGLSVAADPRAQ